jgi:hypothetical protein
VHDNVVQNWPAPHRKSRGGQPRYSDLAIEICLTLRVLFRLALRQTQGFMRSIAQPMNLNLPVPDVSTLSRSSSELKIGHLPRRSEGPITLIVDSTGLKMHGGNGWNAKKHGATRPRKTWRNLHLAFNPDSVARSPNAPPEFRFELGAVRADVDPCNSAGRRQTLSLVKFEPHQHPPQSVKPQTCIRSNTHISYL